MKAMNMKALIKQVRKNADKQWKKGGGIPSGQGYKLQEANEPSLKKSDKP